MTLEPIVIGSGCAIGTSAVLEAGSQVFDKEQVAAWTFLGRTSSSKQSDFSVKPTSYRLLEMIFTLILWMMTVGTAVLPPIWFTQKTANKIPFGVFSVPISLITSYVLFQLGQATLLLLLKWSLIGKVKAGPYLECGWFALRRHALGRLHEILTRDLLVHLTCSVFLGVWYRLLGANISMSAYINTFFHDDFDLITIEDEVLLGGGAELTTSLASETPGETPGESTLRTCRVGKASVIGHKTKILVPKVQPGSKISPIAVVTSMAQRSSTDLLATGAERHVSTMALVLRMILQIMLFGLLFVVAVTAMVPGHRLVRHAFINNESGIVIACFLLLWMITFVLLVATIDLLLSRLLRCFPTDKTTPILSAAGARFLVSLQLYTVTTNLFSVRLGEENFAELKLNTGSWGDWHTAFRVVSSTTRGQGWFTNNHSISVALRPGAR